MEYKPDDLVRIIAVKPGTMIESYLGSEGRVISRSLDGLFYEVELDVGRANLDRGGQIRPRFIVREEQIIPDVTERMLEAAFGAALGEIENSEEYFRAIYRAMRVARFER